MLTRDQAIEAGFYSGANTLSFVDERANNMWWMGPVDPDATHHVKREAAILVFDTLDGVASDETLVTIVVAALLGRALIEPPAPGRWPCWRVFVAVLRSCEQLMREAAEAAVALRQGQAGPAIATASDAAEEDRIDGRNPDPFARITGAPVPFLGTSPVPDLPSLGKRRR